MVENPLERFLIATPTNILKDEVYVKAIKLGINVIKTPSLEAIKEEIPSKVRQRIALLYRTGRHSMVHPYITRTQRHLIRLRCRMDPELHPKDMQIAKVK
jgi:hypothetical protein